MRVRNESSFRAFSRRPRYRVTVSDNTQFLAESLTHALAQADTMKFFGKHCTIQEIKAKENER